MPSSSRKQCECFTTCANCKSTVRKYEVTLKSENGTKVFVYVCKETYRRLTENE